MHRSLMDILACPVCKGPLDLQAEREEGEEVLEGRLSCPRCGEDYPIREGIPDLLPPEVRRELESAP